MDFACPPTCFGDHMANEQRKAHGVGPKTASPAAQGQGPASGGGASWFEMYNPHPTWIGLMPAEKRAIDARRAHWRRHNVGPERNYERCRELGELGERCESSRVKDRKATYRFLVAIYVAVVSAIANRETEQLETMTGHLDMDWSDFSSLIEKLIRHAHGHPAEAVAGDEVDRRRALDDPEGCTASTAYGHLQREGVEKSYKNFATHVRRILRAADARMVAAMPTAGDEDRVVLQVTLVGDIARRCRNIERLGQHRSLRPASGSTAENGSCARSGS